jgi:hypothetical protein
MYIYVYVQCLTGATWNSNVAELQQMYLGHCIAPLQSCYTHVKLEANAGKGKSHELAL